MPFQWGDLLEHKLDKSRKWTPNALCYLKPDSEQRKDMNAAKDKCKVTYKSRLIKITVDLSTETLKDERVWNEAF